MWFSRYNEMSGAKRIRVIQTVLNAAYEFKSHIFLPRYDQVVSIEKVLCGVCMVDAEAFRLKTGLLNCTSSIVLGPIYSGIPSNRACAITIALSFSQALFVWNSMKSLMTFRRFATDETSFSS